MKKSKKQLYEGMYILNPTLSEESRNKAFEKILKGIADHEGEVHKVHEQGRRRLAYSIEGKREGYYYLVYFTAPTEAMAELWKEYHLHEDLLRFLTLQATEVKETLEFKPLKNA